MLRYFLCFGFSPLFFLAFVPASGPAPGSTPGSAPGPTPAHINNNQSSHFNPPPHPPTHLLTLFPLSLFPSLGFIWQEDSRKILQTLLSGNSFQICGYRCCCCCCCWGSILEMGLDVGLSFLWLFHWDSAESSELTVGGSRFLGLKQSTLLWNWIGCGLNESSAGNANDCLIMIIMIIMIIFFFYASSLSYLPPVPPLTLFAPRAKIFHFICHSGSFFSPEIMEKGRGEKHEEIIFPK